MQLAIIRHAVAVDRKTFARTGQPDDERPLTEEGQRKMREAVQGLVRWLPDLELLATSPLTRAVQTADIIRKAYPGLEVQRWTELSPQADPRAVLARLRRTRAGLVGVVSHNPLLPRLVSWLLTGNERPFVEARKGSVHLIDLPQGPEAAEAKLIAALSPALLRRLGRSR